MKELIIWEDLWYAVRVWQDGQATINFQMLDFVGFGEDGKPEYWKQGEVSNFPGTQDPNEAHVLVEGFIKHDGCSHWQFASDDIMLHLCGRDGLAKFQQAQQRLFDEAAKRVRNWTGK